MTVCRGSAQVMRVTAKAGLTAALSGSIRSQTTTEVGHGWLISVNSSRSRGRQVTMRERDSYPRFGAARISTQLGGTSHALTQS